MSLHTRTSGVAPAALAVSTLVLLALASGDGRGDEPRRFARLFRLGNSATRDPAPAPAPEPGLVAADGPGPGLVEPMALPNQAPAARPAAPGGATPRIFPQPRVSRPVTDADPLVTRIALGRSDTGSTFGMFLCVYADGTVVDSEGTHRLGVEAVRPIAEALSRGEVFRLRGHCGAPSTDFVENVQMIVFERRFGGLRANSYSFSGNPQGCDHGVRHLQTLLDGLQAKLGGAVPAASAAVPSAGPDLSPGALVPLSAPSDVEAVLPGP